MYKHILFTFSLLTENLSHFRALARSRSFYYEQQKTQVSEEEYAKLVAKRRKENANFVVGAEENDEYVDLGEDEDWTRQNPNYNSDEDDADGDVGADDFMDEDGKKASGGGE